VFFKNFKHKIYFLTCISSFLLRKIAKTMKMMLFFGHTEKSTLISFLSSFSSSLLPKFHSTLYILSNGGARCGNWFLSFSGWRRRVEKWWRRTLLLSSPMTWRCLVGGGGVFSGHPAWWGPEFLAPPPLPPSRRRCLQRPPSAPPSVSASSSRRCSRTGG